MLTVRASSFPIYEIFMYVRGYPGQSQACDDAGIVLVSLAGKMLMIQCRHHDAHIHLFKPVERKNQDTAFLILLETRPNTTITGTFPNKHGCLQQGQFSASLPP